MEAVFQRKLHQRGREQASPGRDDYPEKSGHWRYGGESWRGGVQDKSRMHRLCAESTMRAENEDEDGVESDHVCKHMCGGVCTHTRRGYSLLPGTDAVLGTMNSAMHREEPARGRTSRLNRSEETVEMDRDVAQNMVGSSRVPRGQTVRDWPVWGRGRGQGWCETPGLRTWVGRVLLGLCQSDTI